MAVSLRHVLDHGAMLRALAGLGRISTTVRPPSASLIRAFVEYTGGDPSAYAEIVPPHLFPQWAVPVAFAALRSTPYPLARVVNAGCKLVQHAPLPLGAPLRVRARLASIDDDGSRAILTTRIVTGTEKVPQALVSEIRAYVPLATRERRERKMPAIVPRSAREIAFVSLDAHAGLDFAKLTGDFNPIHWLPAYARASGFSSTILHGFASFSIAVEALVRRTFSGNARALESIDVRFTKPVVLPARVGVYVDGEQVFVGSGGGAPAHLTGHFR
jgi:acyl dehydratase